MGLLNTIKTKLTGKPQPLSQDQAQEIADIIDPRARILEQIKQDLQQKIAAGVTYELTAQELGQGFANQAYQEMHQFIDALKQYPPEGVNVEILSETIDLYLEMLAFTVFTYTAALMPYLDSPETKDLVRTSLRRQAILMFATSQDKAGDENFLHAGEAFLIDRFRDYFTIFVREETGIEDEWFFRKLHLINTVLKNVCNMSRTPGIVESISPTLHRHFQDMEEIVPMQIKTWKIKVPVAEQDEKK